MARGRSALIAVLLAGFGPGAGHLYAGKPARGALLTGLWIATSLAWVTHVAQSFAAAKLWAFPMLLSLLGLLVDSGVQARRAPRPFPLGPFQRWWVIVLAILVTGFAVPTAIDAALARQAGLVSVWDDGMQPMLARSDRVVHDRVTGDLAVGDVVVLRGTGEPRVRRVVGLPGHRVSVRGGHVVIDGIPWIRDPAWLGGGGLLDVPETTVAATEVLVLPDKRGPGDGAGWRVPLGQVVGHARWILLPGTFDAMRVGQKVD